MITRIIFPMPPRENQILGNTVTYLIFFETLFPAISLFVLSFLFRLHFSSVKANGRSERPSTSNTLLFEENSNTILDTATMTLLRFFRPIPVPGRSVGKSTANEDRSPQDGHESTLPGERRATTDPPTRHRNPHPSTNRPYRGSFLRREACNRSTSN